MRQLSLFNSREEEDYHIHQDYDQIFGNGDAVDEDIEFLRNNFVPFNDLKYYSESRQFLILCAPKGSGKTTIVRLWQEKLAKKKDTISILQYDSDISPAISKIDWTESLRKWKVAMIKVIFKKITGFFPLDFSPKNLPQKSKKIEIEEYLTKLINEHTQPGFESGSYEIKPQVWLFIDEIDQEFTREEKNINKVASMLLGARELCTSLKNLYIRVTVKPNVWAILSQERSALSNIANFKIDHVWKTDNILDLFAKRIEQYLLENRSNFNKLYAKKNHLNSYKYILLNQLFDPKNFDLGRGQRHQHIILSKLGIHRPRWTLQLCLNASALSQKNSRITINDIRRSMTNYGKDRIADISSEYINQCPQIKNIIQSYMFQNAHYLCTKGALEFIDKNITSRFITSIAGVNENCNSVQILNFLYELGFIEPKRLIKEKEIKKDYEHIHFIDNPNLLLREDNEFDDGLIWEVHPAFRKPLKLSTVKYKITKL